MRKHKTRPLSLHRWHSAKEIAPGLFVNIYHGHLYPEWQWVHWATRGDLWAYEVIFRGRLEWADFGYHRTETVLACAKVAAERIYGKELEWDAFTI